MPRYTDIMETLVEEIRKGKYLPLTALPSEKMMCHRFSASRTSVRNALRLMQEQGYIERRQGSGSFVRNANVEAINGIVNLGLIFNHNSKNNMKQFVSNPILDSKFKGIRDAAVKSGANQSIFMYSEDAPINEALFAGYRIDGFLDTGNTISADLNRHFIEHDCKVCSITNSFHLNDYFYHWPLVVNDYLTGVREAIRYYQKAGLRRFGFFATAKRGATSFALYQNILRKQRTDFDLDAVVLFPKISPRLYFEQERAEYFANKMFTRNIFPEVLFTDGHFISEELIVYLQKSTRGRKILDSIRICDVAGPMVERLHPYEMVDHVVPNNEGVGRIAAELLIRQIKEQSLTENRILVPASFQPTGGRVMGRYL